MDSSYLLSYVFKMFFGKNLNICYNKQITGGCESKTMAMKFLYESFVKTVIVFLLDIAFSKGQSWKIRLARVELRLTETAASLYFLLKRNEVSILMCLKKSIFFSILKLFKRQGEFKQGIERQ